jgi:glyoxylase-like metal-dependent hydrolase (beta-lactamase superfamily II)
VLRIVPFTFNPFQENTYVVHDGHEAVLVDPGCWNTGEEHELESYLTENGLTPVKVVLTHAHIDHVMGCAWAEKRYGLRPWMHRDGEELLKRAPAQATIYGLHCDPAPPPAGHLGEGDVVMLGNARMEVLFVPGHAPGHIALYLPEEQAVVAGDVLFHRSIGRTDLPGGDLDTLLSSITTKLFPLAEEVVVHSGHGPTTTIGDERRHNPFLKAFARRN